MFKKLKEMLKAKKGAYNLQIDKYVNKYLGLIVLCAIAAAGIPLVITYITNLAGIASNPIVNFFAAGGIIVLVLWFGVVQDVINTVKK